MVYTSDVQLRDKIIKATYDSVNKGNLSVYTNYSTGKSVHIKGLFPDIIITPKDTLNVQFIVDVVSERVVMSDRIKLWKQYSKLGGTFYLVVNNNFKIYVESLCIQNGIKARFGVFKSDWQGNITVKFD